MNLKNLLIFLTLISISIFSFTSCDSKLKPAVGNEDEIYVFADSTEFEAVEGSLLQVFGKIIYTPQPEKLFNLNRQNLKKLEKYKNKKNIIFVAPLNSGSQTSKFISKYLDSNVVELVENDSEYVFNKYGLWAADQLVMFLTSPSLEQLNRNILEGHEDLLYYFQNISNKRLFKSVYNEKYEKKEIEAELLRDHGWIIYVQADFQLALNNPDDNFVWLRRAPNSDIERWIFVHWIDNASPAFLEPDSIYKERNRITEKYLRTADESSYVMISDYYMTTHEVNFNDRYALMTQGLWKMEDETMGGPFINYTFFDEKTKRIYMVDGSVYAPKYYKKKIIQQVNVILRSFMTEDELTDDKIEDLLDELD